MKRSFIISYKESDEDRRNNLKRLLSYLSWLLDAESEIVLVEQDTISKIDWLSSIKRHEQINHIFVENNGIFNKGWGYNIGVKQSKGEYIIIHDQTFYLKLNSYWASLHFLDSYDIIKPYKIKYNLDKEKSNKFFSNNFNFGIVRSVKWDDNLNDISDGIFILKRNTYLLLKGFDETINAFEYQKSSFNIKIDKFHLKVNTINDSSIQVFEEVNEPIPIDDTVTVFENNEPINQDEQLNSIHDNLEDDEMKELVNSTEDIGSMDVLSKFNYKKFLKIKPISIIITAYQSQDYIEECLDSIESQSYFVKNKKYEILLGIDNCEETLKKVLEIRHKYRNLKVFMMSSNKGTYITSNTLISLSKKSNILRFDSDDIMMPDMVKTILLYSDNYNVIRFGYDNKGMKTGVLVDGSIFYKKNIMKLAGGYRDWVCGADTELMSRISSRVNVKEIKHPLYYRRFHKDSLTESVNTGIGSQLRNDYTKQIRIYNSIENIKIDRVVNSYTLIKNKYQLPISNMIELNDNDNDNDNEMILGIQIVNYNNLKYTRDCVNDLFNQINKNFKLFVVDQNSNEDGTIEYLNDIEKLGVTIVRNPINVDLNRVWNKFYEKCKSDYLCFLNNDIRITNNFTDDIIKIFEIESEVGAVIHVTNNLDYTKSNHKLNYEILSPPLCQGWDYTIRRKCYNVIPNDLRIFGGDDFLFGKMVKDGYDVAMTYSSPVIHYKEKTREMFGSAVKNINKLDIKNFHIQRKIDQLEIIPSSFSTDRCNKYSPENIYFIQNKKCIFTGIVGDYDDLTTSTTLKQDDWDYICYTENDKIESDFWKIITIPKFNDSILGNHKLARYIKTNFFNYLSSYDIILWKDARIVINCNLNDYLHHLGDNDILFMRHPDSNNILDEFNSVLSLNLESLDTIEKIKLRYAENGYNYDNGLIASGIMLFKNNEKTKKFFQDWWDEISHFSHRDQLSGNYVIFKNPDLIYDTIPQRKVISNNGYFLRGVRKSKRFKL